ncbi:TraR/DksA C4-type zinc finger protein [soil metagenome]
MSDLDRVTRALAEATQLLEVLRSQHAELVEASRESNADDEHDPEGATIGFERAQLDATIASTRAQVEQLLAARTRIDLGTYGMCEVCGEPIPSARLEVRPAATTCVRHAG